MLEIAEREENMITKEDRSVGPPRRHWFLIPSVAVDLRGNVFDNGDRVPSNKGLEGETIVEALFTECLSLASRSASIISLT